MRNFNNKAKSLLVGNFLIVFPNDWKKERVIPVHKKWNKQKVSNYCPVSLLPICSDIFEKLILHSIYDFLDRNCLFNVNQSVFRPDDTCMRLLIAITHNIFTAFDANPTAEVRSITLDLFKTLGFDMKVFRSNSKKHEIDRNF